MCIADRGGFYNYCIDIGEDATSMRLICVGPTSLAQFIFFHYSFHKSSVVSLSKIGSVSSKCDVLQNMSE